MTLKLSYYDKKSDIPDKKSDIPDGRKSHTCCICQHVGKWNKNWAWYGSLKDEEDGDVDKVCSKDCVAAYNAKHRIPLSKRRFDKR